MVLLSFNLIAVYHTKQHAKFDRLLITDNIHRSLLLYHSSHWAHISCVDVKLVKDAIAVQLHSSSVTLSRENHMKDQIPLQLKINALFTRLYPQMF